MSHWKIGVKILCVVLKRGSIFYGSLKNRGQNSKLKYGGQIYIFFSWNPWSKFYVPWKGGSKFYIFSQCLEKGESKPRSLPTNFTEGVPPPPPPPPPPRDHGINSYKGRHKQHNRSKRFPIYRLRRPTRLHRNPGRRRHTQEFTGQGYDG